MDEIGKEIPVIDSDDLQRIELELDEPPVHEYLAVFILDPRNPEQYWFRKMRISKNTSRTVEFPYIDIERLDMGTYDIIPCPEDQLEVTRRNVSRWERELVGRDPETRKIQADVGVARYQGNKPLSLDEIIELVGLKYHQIRESFRTFHH